MTHRNLWKELESEATSIGFKGIQKRMIGTKNICPMFIGIKQPGMKKTFIVQTPKTHSILSGTLPEFKGFELDVRIVGDELESDFASIILNASNEEYNEIFVTIAEDLFQTLICLDKKKDVANSFLNRILLWQSFFEKQGADGLTADSQKGLFGELFFYQKYLLSQFPAEPTLRYWLGSKNRQHDFQFGPVSVEVKTSSAKKHQKIKITSEQQLDETLVEELYLFHLSVSIVENSDVTLPSLVNSIRESLKENRSILQLFNSILLERGYHDIHFPLYKNTGYSIRNSSFFLIRDDFPRIMEKDLRTGVGDVKYSVNIDNCINYSIPDIEFLNRLGKILR
jgi:hypothetical protein